MKTNRFLSALRRDELTAAIAAAERHTSGEIRLIVSGQRVADPVAAAEDQFRRLDMTLTRARNGVLIFLAPADRAFAVIGDIAIHQHCGDEFWQRLVAEMTAYFQQEDPQQALLHAISRVGAVLAEHFPRDEADRNELPDAVEVR